MTAKPSDPPASSAAASVRSCWLRSARSRCCWRPVIWRTRHRMRCWRGRACRRSWSGSGGPATAAGGWPGPGRGPGGGRRPQHEFLRRRGGHRRAAQRRPPDDMEPLVRGRRRDRPGVRASRPVVAGTAQVGDDRHDRGAEPGKRRPRSDLPLDPLPAGYHNFFALAGVSVIGL